MKFSTKTTYGLRALIRLANSKNGRNMSLATIANEENISLGYLEKIFSKLKEAKIVQAEKGVSGGYSLIKSPDQINALDIIKTLEGQKNLFHCLDSEGKVYCSKSCDCGANLVLLKLQESLNNTLKSIKLSEMIKS